MKTLTDLYKLEGKVTTDELVAAVAAAEQEPGSPVKGACVMVIGERAFVMGPVKLMGPDFPYHSPELQPGGIYRHLVEQTS